MHNAGRPSTSMPRGPISIPHLSHILPSEALCCCLLVAHTHTCRDDDTTTHARAREIEKSKKSIHTRPQEEARLGVETGLDDWRARTRPAIGMGGLMDPPCDRPIDLHVCMMHAWPDRSTDECRHALTRAAAKGDKLPCLPNPQSHTLRIHTNTEADQTGKK